MRREYGGYLPFEVREGEDWFSAYGEDRVLRTNSAKTAIYCAVRNSGIHKLYVPYYMCRSVKQMLLDADVETEFYYVDERLLPVLSRVDAGAAVLLVNYFGIMEELVRAEAEKYPTVIIDNSHAYFAAPVLREGVCNVYSCRKFIGVPDGGYLVGEGCAFPAGRAGGVSAEGRGDPARESGVSAAGRESFSLEPDEVSGHFSYLVTSFEHGTNAAYAEKQESDRYFAGNYRGMSRLTRGMLSSVDYDGILRRREENFAYLHDCLRDLNRMEISEQQAPAFVYPFLPGRAAKSGNNLKADLVAEKIYVPTMWRELAVPEFAGTLEYLLSERAAFLPVDQRYGREDMRYIADRVRDLLEE